MADPDENEAPKAINAYLIERVKKLELEVQRLNDQLAIRDAFLEDCRPFYEEQLDEARAFFAVVDGTE